jgi:PAS domain S-box-containing protein/diguanylate cyclase (GGDEF)-like protein
MIDYAKRLMSLTSNFELDSGNMNQLIQEGLYITPSLFSVDRAGLWVLNKEEEAYICEADFFNDIIHHEAPQRLDKKEDSDIFSFLVSTSETIIDKTTTQQLFGMHTSKILSVFRACSILLIPLHVNGKNRGFIFLGDSRKCIEWSPDIIFASRILAQLFCRTVLALDNRIAETKLQHQYQLMYEIEKLAKIGGWDYEISTGITNWTDETCRIYGLSPNEKITVEVAINFYSTDVQQIIKSAFELAVSQLKPYALELPFIDAQGNHKWVKTTGQIRRNSQGAATHIYGAFEDITEQKRLFNSEKSISEDFKSIVDNLNDSIVTISSKGLILSANRMLEKTFGYLQSEVIGKNVSMLMPIPFASRHDKYINNYLNTGQAKIIGVGRELEAIKKDGTIFPMELSISEVSHANETVFIGIVRDITERKKSEKHIHQLAYHDDTTGVMNRYSLERDLKKHFDKSLQSNDNITAMLINLDKFSQVNLTYGEDVGDLILKEIAKRLNERLPSWAVTYRSNADSFYIILNVADDNNFDEEIRVSNEELAAQILEEINQTIFVSHHVINIQASIGILNILAKEVDYIDIKPLLELAVFNVKSQGGNSYVYASNNDTNLLKRHSELSLAMKSNRFTSELNIVLQPQYSTDGKIVGSEALVRWHSPTLRSVSPAEFIPLAEKNGAIIELGNWMIDKACILLSQRRIFSKKSSPISVNISAKQIAQPAFIDNLLKNLDKYQIPYSELLLELTESALITDLKLVVSKMKLLKRKGILFAIDDFGTGYSSLSYIHHLPIKVLKIDKCFVDNIKNEIDEVPIINTILQMAKSLKLKVVAEGVESKEQLNYLASNGCDVIQGYYFSKPLTSVQWLDIWAGKDN